jgi:polysaccharide pyruvyl transferase WcaK-like protein
METMKGFARWLVDNGRRIRFYTGDDVDEGAVREIVADVRACRPGLDPAWLTAEPITSLTDLMRQMSGVDSVVATRYHNVLCALKLSKPTLSLGYAAKNDALMADMGVPEYCQSARSLDLDLLIKQFAELESRSGEVKRTLLARNSAKAQDLDQQFAVLSSLLFAAPDPAGGRAYGRLAAPGGGEDTGGFGGFWRFAGFAPRVGPER